MALADGDPQWDQHQFRANLFSILNDPRTGLGIAQYTQSQQGFFASLARPVAPSLDFHAGHVPLEILLSDEQLDLINNKVSLAEYESIELDNLFAQGLSLAEQEMLASRSQLECSDISYGLAKLKEIVHTKDLIIESESEMHPHKFLDAFCEHNLTSTEINDMPLIIAKERNKYIDALRKIKDLLSCTINHREKEISLTLNAQIELKDLLETSCSTIKSLKPNIETLRSNVYVQNRLLDTCLSRMHRAVLAKEKLVALKSFHSQYIALQNELSQSTKPSFNRKSIFLWIEKLQQTADLQLLASQQPKFPILKQLIPKLSGPRELLHMNILNSLVYHTLEFCDELNAGLDPSQLSSTNTFDTILAQIINQKCFGLPTNFEAVFLYRIIAVYRRNCFKAMSLKNNSGSDSNPETTEPVKTSLKSPPSIDPSLDFVLPESSNFATNQDPAPLPTPAQIAHLFETAFYAKGLREWHDRFEHLIAFLAGFKAILEKLACLIEHNILSGLCSTGNVEITDPVPQVKSVKNYKIQRFLDLIDQLKLITAQLIPITAKSLIQQRLAACKKLPHLQYLRIRADLNTVLARYNASLGTSTNNNDLAELMSKHFKEFFEEWHQKRLVLLDSSLENEAWTRALVPSDYQHIANTIFSLDFAVSDPASLSQSNLEKTTRHHLYIQNTPYSVCNACLYFISQIKDYCVFASTAGQEIGFVTQPLFAFIETFCQSISYTMLSRFSSSSSSSPTTAASNYSPTTSVSAVSSSSLGNVHTKYQHSPATKFNAKHSSFAYEAINVVSLLLKPIKTHFKHCHKRENLSDDGLMSERFETMSRSLAVVKAQILDKMGAIMEAIIDHNLTFGLDEDAKDGSSMPCSQAMGGIATDLKKLYLLTSTILDHEALNLLFKKVFVILFEKLKHIIKRTDYMCSQHGTDRIERDCMFLASHITTLDKIAALQDLIRLFPSQLK